MKQPKRTKTWERTRLQNLIRHRSGRYYARAFADGKEVWKSLKTSHFSVAEARLAEFLKQNREHRLNETEVRKITHADCKKWASTYAKNASATNYNNTVALVRHVLSIAIEAGVIYSSPAAALKRATLRRKEITLPTTDKFIALIAEMRAAHSRDSQNCADLAEGLAFTGCRKGEANQIEFRDLDFDAGELVVRGDAATGTKNWEVRRVPLIPDARTLFSRMRSERADEPLDAKVFRVRECQKALDRACKKVGADRITHHDLRHLFATRCIESGVDIPTVSRWLGHKDGGALAMKTYGHLRREHSIAQAQKVSFAPVVAEQADIIAFPARNP